jgi:hypothetical protein
MKIGIIGRFLLTGSLLLVDVPVRGEVIPGRWDKLEQQRRHLLLTITLRSGDRLEATYQGTTGEALVVRTLEGAELQVPKADVAQVGTIVDDPVTDGVLWGLAAGFGAAFTGILLGCAVANECTGESDARLGAIWGLAGAGVGTVTGLVIDDARKKREVLYQAPPPATPANP